MRHFNQVNRREFMGLAALSAGALALPAELEGALPQNPVVDTVMHNGTPVNHEKEPWKVLPFPNTQVRLTDGIFKQQMEANLGYLRMLPNDRLAHTFRITAGLPSTAEPLGGWEKPDCELRGHFTGGHYLSAAALMYASTGDEDLKKKADDLVATLAQCQQALGTGYLSAFPVEFFDRLRDGKQVWAPFYTIHKIMAGHLDMYTHCGNEQALDTAQKMAGWVGGWVGPLSEDHMQRVLEVEQGGMLEVLCNLYAVTGNRRYLMIANRFDHHAVFDPLAEYKDELQELHANTNIPKMIGAARQYEVTGDPRFHNIADFFWTDVTARRVFCSGGTSYREHWLAPAGDLGKEVGQTMEECCCGYNMLKLTRHIYGWTADPRAMDYYERTLFNSRLGTQDPQGLKSYFLSLGRGWWKYYNSPYNSFWCCTGTGAEEFSKFNNTIYFHDDHGVYVNLFIASEVNWPEKGLRLRQETNFPEQEGTVLVVRAQQPARLAVNIRIPYWATKGGSVKLNGEALPVFSSPSSYLTLDRVWKNGDRVEVSLPMSLRAEALPGDLTQQAMMYGPLVLAGELGSEGLNEADTHPGYNTFPVGKPVEAPEITASTPAGWVESIGKLKFQTAGQTQPTSLKPLYQIAGERYVVYWKVNSSTA
ncbi:MAG TPA: glycoside hydrolase family 127 protein [Terriglobia bacterium]|nr:glycoside hydrolase family 127 protein [Terriglobia bacterium]